jgi:hypothetical protein
MGNTSHCCESVPEIESPTNITDMDLKIKENLAG